MKKQEAPEAAPALSAGLRRFLYLTAATTGAAIMIVEILGAKMLTPYVGTSHFVWTAQIAVTLVALAAGYAVGGWLVDRSPQLAWIYACILGAAGYLCLSVLGCEWVAFACLRFRLAVGSLLASAGLFFVPLALLAMVGPFFVRILTSSVTTVGANMGRLTSISTLGSVVGTVLIGYVLIPFLPNALTMFLTAGGLMLVSVAYFLGWARRGLAPALLAVGLSAATGGVGVMQRTLVDPDRMSELYRGNSNFGLLQVLQNREGDRRLYLNDLLTQNTFEVGTSQSLSLFTYMLHDLAQAYTPRLERALCIGVGVGIVPGQLAREGVRVDAVEINPAIIPVAAKYFNFKPEQVQLHLGDGRYFVAQAGEPYDAIILDAFLGESPPSHLMTREAFQAMKRRLKPEGVLVMNTFGDFAPGRDFFCASVDQTLKSVFESVRIHACGNGNVFFVAANRPELRSFRTPDFERMPWDVRGQAQAAWTGVMQTNPDHGRVLTDNYNPVDFYDAANRENLRRRLALSMQAL